MKEEKQKTNREGALQDVKPITSDRILDDLLATDTFQMKLNALRLAEKHRDRDQPVKVSVIMPTWNRKQVIGRAIASVCKQTYKNYELIVCDDGSTDGTLEFVRSLLGQDSDIIYLRYEHSGVSCARNHGLSRCSGDLVAYLDSDNVWDENYLLLMVNTFMDKPQYTSGYCAIRVTQKIEKKGCILFTEYDRNALVQQNFIDMNVFMHRKSLYEQMGGFDEGLSSLEDWDLILRYTKDNPPFFLKACLAVYFREDGLRHLSSEKRLAKNFRKIRSRYT